MNRCAEHPNLRRTITAARPVGAEVGATYVLLDG